MVGNGRKNIFNAQGAGTRRNLFNHSLSTKFFDFEYCYPAFTERSPVVDQRYPVIG
jgi:hypothetical protein